MKIVTCFGGVFRLTDAEYEKMLRDTIKGDGFSLPASRCIGDLVENVTDLSEDRAEELLEELKAERKEKRGK